MDLNGIISRDIQLKQEKKAQKKEISFREYLKLVEKNPLIAQPSPARLLEIVMGAGAEKIMPADRWLETENRYKLWGNKLFGIELQTEQFVNFLKAGEAGLSTGKQIVLLVGPPASGKSTFVGILKRELENYKNSVYAIKGCPIYEEPLHLLPRYLREGLSLKPEECSKFPECKGKHLHLGIKLEGDLCPHCRYKLEETFTDKDTGETRWWDVPVQTFTFSIQGSRGIASFEPSDEKSSDVTELVGQVNIPIWSTKGSDHPLAYSLSGELEKANRGIFEGRELIKADEKLLWVFISVAEEKEIKVQGSTMPHVSIDTTLIGHTNLNEYKKFTARQENEALHDRIYVIPFPYPLRIKDEIKVYQKLVQTEGNLSKLKKCHIAPGTFELTAIFAILTRLNTSDVVDPLTKLKLYNGDKALTEETKEKKPVDLRALIEEGQNNPDISKREGMFGVGSRDVLAAINEALVKEESNGCLTPLKALRALREVFDHRMGYTPEDVERYKLILSADWEGGVMQEYKEYVVKAVSKAFLRAYDDLAREMFRRYIEEITLLAALNFKHVRGQALDIPRDEITGRPKEADKKFIRSVEEFAEISESEAANFRSEILQYKSMDKSFSYDTYPPLAEAIEKKLLSDSKASLTLVLASDKPKGEEEKKRVNDLFSALEENGYCEICAKEAVERAKEFLSD